MAASLSLSLVFVLVLSTFLFGYRDTAFRAFTSDPAVLELLFKSVNMILAAFAMDAICTVVIGGLKPLGDRWIPQAGYGAILLVVGVTFGSLAVPTPNLGVTDMLTSLVVSYFAAALFVLGRAQRNPYLRLT